MTDELHDGDLMARDLEASLGLARESLVRATYPIGLPVDKASGYRFPGWVVAAFSKRDGQVRYVVEDDRGCLHVFAEAQLVPRRETP